MLKNLTLLSVFLAVFSLFAISACDSEVENRSEEVGEKIDDATQEVSRGVNNFNQDVRDFIDKNKTKEEEK